MIVSSGTPSGNFVPCCAFESNIFRNAVPMSFPNFLKLCASYAMIPSAKLRAISTPFTTNRFTTKLVFIKWWAVFFNRSSASPFTQFFTSCVHSVTRDVSFTAPSRPAPTTLKGWLGCAGPFAPGWGITALMAFTASRPAPMTSPVSSAMLFSKHLFSPARSWILCMNDSMIPLTISIDSAETSTCRRVVVAGAKTRGPASEGEIAGVVVVCAILNGSVSWREIAFALLMGNEPETVRLESYASGPPTFCIDAGVASNNAAHKRRRKVEIIPRHELRKCSSGLSDATNA
mmetsp:Transcript_3791/g.6129  ORF Transcript_3791/g.6129 Transcript_3791/m.6129 type:complete len:289 (-) Transcript_3791:38-904(-)